MKRSRMRQELVMSAMLAGLLVVSVPAVGSIALGAVALDSSPAITTQPQLDQRPSPESINAWPMFGADPGNTGHINTTGPTDDVTKRWDFSTGGMVRSSPAVADGTVYAGSGDGNVYALAAETGTLQWMFETDSRVSSSPAVVDGIVYVGSKDSNVYAIDAKTGTRKWTVETDGQVASPTVVGDTIYVGSQNMYALDASTGQERWNSSINPSGVPAVGDGTVYVIAGFDLYALNTETGAAQWSFKVDGLTESSPAVVDDTVYIGSQLGRVFAVNAKTGNEIWNHTTEFSVKSSPAIVDDTLYVGTGDQSSDNRGRVIALFTENGTERWTFEIERAPTKLSGAVTSSPAVVNGTVYVGSRDHTVYALHTETGTVRWTFETRNSIHTSPAVVDGIVYFANDDSNVYALSENQSTQASQTVDTPKAAGSTQSQTEAVSEPIPGFGVAVLAVGFFLLTGIFTMRIRKV